MQSTIEYILNLLSKGEALILATIIDHNGSTPRDTGTRFVISENRNPFGTIGGGLVEAQVLKRSKKLFETGECAIVNYDMTHSQLTADKMVCGGTMSVLMEYFRPDDTSIAFFTTLQNIYKERREAMLIINLDQLKQAGGTTSHVVMLEGEIVFESIEPSLSTPVLAAELKSELRGKRAIIKNIESIDCWVEALDFPKKLFLFGAGHVARPTAELGSKTEFQTLVADDREELLTADFFPEPIKRFKIDDYDTCMARMSIDNNSYIVILTRGHTCDKAILAQALRSEAVYIGMIGSRRKRNTIYNVLLSEGFTQQELGRVHCPIGIDIGANTPAEIGVSILAELIKFRSSAG